MRASLDVALALVALAAVTLVVAVAAFATGGRVGSILLILLAAGAALHATGSRRSALLLALAVVLGVNLKQSVPAFVVVLLAAGWAATRVAGGTRARGAHLAAAVAGIVAGVAAVGAHPWLTNIARYEHPAYPYAQTAESVAKGNLRGSDLVRSMVSRSVHATDYRQARTLVSSGTVKWPFAVSRAEIEVFRYEGVRIGGWGPLYSGTLVLGLATALLAARRSPRGALALAILGAGILTSAALLPESEVARFVPHVWLLPLLPLPLAMRAGGWSRRAAWLTIALAAANVALVMIGYLPAAVRHSVWLEHKLHSIPAGSPIDLGVFASNRARLHELGIDFRRVEDPACSLDLYLGLRQPRIVAPRLLSGAPGTFRIDWSKVHGATRYALELVLSPPRGPFGGALTVVRKALPGTVRRADLPPPRGPFSVTVAACNRLGCGVPVVRGPLRPGAPQRRAPVLGSPEPGATVSPVLTIAWLPAADATTHRVQIIDDSGEIVLDEVCEHPYRRTLLPPDRHLHVTVTTIGGPSDGAAVGPVEFTTGPLPAPVPRAAAPAAGGVVSLAWDEVEGALSYEYLVTVQGRRPTARGCTDGSAVTVDLPQSTGGEVTYHAIVRACPSDALCRCGSEEGWAPGRPRPDPASPP